MIKCPNCGNLTKEQIELYNQNLRKQNFTHIPILPTCKFCHSVVEISHKCLRGNVIVLTGTCGSGKSTVAEILVQKGFLAIDGDCAIQSAKFKRNGESVDYREALNEISYEIDVLSMFSQNLVLAVVVHPDDVQKYKEMLKTKNLKYKFILLKPSFQAALARCQTRTCHKSITPEYWINYFYDLLQYDDEVEIVDNTNMTAEETAEYIIRLIESENYI
jgi:gluconate kinase